MKKEHKKIAGLKPVIFWHQTTATVSNENQGVALLVSNMLRPQQHVVVSHWDAVETT